MKLKDSKSYKIFTIFNTTFLTILSLVWVIPCLYVVVVSIRPELDLIKSGPTLFPREFTIDAYAQVFNDGKTMRALGVSSFITFVGTSLSLILTFMLAYPLSKSNLPGNRVITFLIYFTMLFNGGLIPSFLVVQALGLINTVWALILPGVISAWNMILVRNFITDLPIEIEEAAKADGCSDFRYFLGFILPLSKPVIATIGLFYAIGYWNEWFSALIFIEDRNLWPLQLLLRQIIMIGTSREISQAQAAAGYIPPNETLKMAVVVVATLPILFVYPFAQKHFTKGITLGSVKG